MISIGSIQQLTLRLAVWTLLLTVASASFQAPPSPGEEGSVFAKWDNLEELKAKKKKPDGVRAETISTANCILGLIMRCSGDPKKLSNPKFKENKGETTVDKDNGKKSGVADLKGKPGKNDASAVSKDKDEEPSADPDKPHLGGKNKNGFLQNRTKWTDFAQAISDSCISVGDNVSVDEGLKSRKGETDAGAQTVILDKAFVDAATGAIGSGTSHDQMWGMLNLAALLFHEGVHLKQSDDLKLDKREPAGYLAQEMFGKFLLDWFCEMQAGKKSAVSKLEQELFDSIETAFGEQDAKEKLEELAKALEELEPPSADTGSGSPLAPLPIAGAQDRFSLRIADLRVLVIERRPTSGWEVSIANWGHLSGPLVSFTIPYEEVLWVLHGDISNSALAAVQDAGVESILLLVDSDQDGFPDSVGATRVIQAGTSIAADEVSSIWDYNSGEGGALLFYRDAGIVRTLIDSDGDSIPETMLPYSFAGSPDLVDAHLGLVWVGPDGWEMRFRLDEPYMDGESPPAMRLADTDGNWFADLQLTGSWVSLFPRQLAPVFMDHVPDWDLPVAQAGELVVANGVGASVVHVITGGEAQGVFTVHDLSAGGALIGSLVAAPDRREVAIPLSTPLEVGHLIELTSTTSGKSSRMFVTPDETFDYQQPRIEELHSQEFLGSAYDFDANGVLDVYMTVGSEEIRALYIGLRDSSGFLVETRVLCLPDEVATVIPVETAAPQYMEVYIDDWYDDPLGTHPRRMDRVPGAPAVGLVWLVGDINGDGISPDALLIEKDLGNDSFLVHVGLTDALGGRAWSVITLPPSQKVVTYEVLDADGDGDLDLRLVCQTLSGDGESILYRWDSQGFDMWDGPILMTYGGELASQGQIEVPYYLEVMCGQESCGSPYVMALSATGTSPGFLMDGVNIPLVYDSLTVWALAQGDSQTTQGFVGTTDSDGHASALLLPPLGSYAPGTTIYAAFALLDATSSVITAASNPVQFTLL